MMNQDLTLTVNPGEMTLDEFDRAVRGFRAKLQAYGDVFKMTDRVPVVTEIPRARPMASTARIIMGTYAYNKIAAHPWLAFDVRRIKSGTTIALHGVGKLSKPFVYDRNIHARKIITVPVDERNIIPLPGYKYSHLFGV